MRPWDLVANGMDALIAPSFGAPGFVARSKSFEPLPNLSGKQFGVTGANAGIGLAATIQLHNLGAHIHMICRSVERAKSAVEHAELTNVTIHQCDVSDLDSVRAFAANFDTNLDGLAHNAGALFDERQTNPQGLELTYALHVVGPMLMTDLLSERLAGARVVIVSSGGMYTQKLSIKRLTTGGPDPFDGVVAYAQCKRAQVILAGLLKMPEIDMVSMHPGWVETDGVKSALPGFYRVTRSFLRTPEQGADTIVWLLAAPEVKSGEFYFDRMIRKQHFSDRTKTDPAIHEALWDEVRSHF